MDFDRFDAERRREEDIKLQHAVQQCATGARNISLLAAALSQAGMRLGEQDAFNSTAVLQETTVGKWIKSPKTVLVTVAWSFRNYFQVGADGQIYEPILRSLPSELEVLGRDTENQMKHVGNRMNYIQYTEPYRLHSGNVSFSAAEAARSNPTAWQNDPRREITGLQLRSWTELYTNASQMNSTTIEGMVGKWYREQFTDRMNIRQRFF